MSPLGSRSCPPPRGFKPANKVKRAWLAESPPSFAQGNRRLRGKKGEGKKYEAQVFCYLEGRFPDQVVLEPWLCFDNGGRYPRWCQPDALVFDLRHGTITIVEVKLQHTAAAWWQLNGLYRPVVSCVFPSDIWRFCLVEIVRWYDPQVVLPTEPILRRSLDELRADKMNVHIWNPAYSS